MSTGLELRVAATGELGAAELTALRALWHDAFDGDFADTDADHALGGVHVLAHLDGVLVGHASVVPRSILVGEGDALTVWDAGYVEAVCTLRPVRGRGVGRAVMRALQEELVARHDLGVLSTGVPLFYESLGWRSWRGPSYVVRAGGRQRTPEDDDSLMVLVVDPDRPLDLTAPIACEERPGDDW